MSQEFISKSFPNGDVAVYDEQGLTYLTPDAQYTVELVPPEHDFSDTPFGVDLVYATHDERGLAREQRLTLAEYHSYMSAEEHVREVEQTLLEQGHAGLPTEMALVAAMPYEADEPLYLVARYPPAPEAEQATLNLIRLDGAQLDSVPVARGPVAEMNAVEQRLLTVQDDAAVLLQTATTEAVQARELAPDTALFAREGDEAMPVTFDNDLTPFDTQGRYLPHHRDDAGTVHFFAVVAHPAEDAAMHELCYFQAQKTDADITLHDTQSLMPVTNPGTSPWPLPALHWHLEEGDLEAAQTLAQDTAQDYGLAQPTPGWTHVDAALVLSGADDYRVGVVDVYAHHDTNQWAARYLPLGEFDTREEARAYQQQTVQQHAVEGPEGANFNDSPAIYERIALAEADAALTDLLERCDGQLPPDYEADHEPEWEPLAANEWQAYRAHVKAISEPVYASLPTATPGVAGDALIAASVQPDAPYVQADTSPQDIAPTWRLDIVPAHDPDGVPLGYSAVCVVDFADLAEVIELTTPERAQWLEVAQFQTEDRAQQFREDFMALVDEDAAGHITGPALAGVLADDLGMKSKWQVMGTRSLAELKAGEWKVTHKRDEWEPRIGERASPDQAVGAASPDIDL